MNSKNLSTTLGRILLEKKMTLAVAESCTGGMIGSAITDIAGASRYFLGGIIAYDTNIKKSVLHVPRTTLNKYGAVSRQTVTAMAHAVRKLMKADCSIAVSGIAGPGGGTREKPVGLVYIGIAVKNSVKSFKYRFKGTRENIRKQTVKEALRLLIRLL
ncbi:MAG: CinA family protein [Chitinispirillaceae bacterium]|jgi:PncC family amidohydrolase